MVKIATNLNTIVCACGMLSQAFSTDSYKTLTHTPFKNQFTHIIL